MSNSISNSNGRKVTEKRQDIRFAEKDESLRKDVRLLGTMFGELLLEQGGEALYKTVVPESHRAAIDKRDNS